MGVEGWGSRLTNIKEMFEMLLKHPVRVSNPYLDGLKVGRAEIPS